MKDGSRIVFIGGGANITGLADLSKSELKLPSKIGTTEIFGNMKNKFYKDEIRFVLFPLFLQTREGEEINSSFLWPFFAYYKGRMSSVL